MKVKILASGSKGNSTLIETNNKNILIDIGLPMSNLTERLQKTGEIILKSYKTWLSASCNFRQRMILCEPEELFPRKRVLCAYKGE